MKHYYHNKEKYIFENHRFQTEIPSDAKWLVVGTFPTLVRNFKFDYYYSSETNIFWRIIGELFGKEFSCQDKELAVSDRKKFLLDNRIGITDMIEMCYRKANSSQDSDIIPVKLRDIFLMLDNYPTIDTVVLTSRSGIVSAKGLFETLFLLNNKEFDFKEIDNNILKGEFEKGRKIRVLVPYSTSRSFHKDDPVKYRQIKSMYAYCFDKIVC